MKRVGQIYRENLSNRLKDGLKKQSVFVLSYTKMPGARLNDLRKTLRQAGADVFVSKNSIAQITLKEIKQDRLAENIKEQTAFVWSDADSVEVSKALIKFAKECENVKIQGGILEGKGLESADVKKLADLPSREVLLSMLLGTLQSPLTRLAGALIAKNRDLLSILKQLSEKKGGN